MRAVVLALAGLTLGAAPPARLTPGQGKLLRERDGSWDAGLKSWRGGKRDEAVRLLRKVLEIESGVLGPWHRW